MCRYSEGEGGVHVSSIMVRAAESVCWGRAAKHQS